MNRLLVAAVAIVPLALSAALPVCPAHAASSAIDADVIAALSAEIERSKKLAIKGSAAPYFIGYKVTEVQVNDVAASLGSTTAKKQRHFAGIEAWVRVGSYDFDNTNFIIPRQEETDGSVTMGLPLEPDVDVARETAWRVTDAAFKEALEQLTTKKATIPATARGTVPSYSKAEPVIMLEPVVPPPLESEAQLEQRAHELSAVFRDQPHIRDSRVSYTSFLERRWILNSEGTRAHDTRRVTGMLMVASAQADDGEIVSLYTSHYGRTMADLPSTAELVVEAKTMVDQLDKLRTAPIMNNYTGPVLFEGFGATGVVRGTLAPHLGGTPLPTGMAATDAARFGEKFADRLGLRVVAPLLSVVDDPTTNTVGKDALIGGYKIDDEGMRSQRVEVIDNGTLETLLMSRTPSAQSAQSNGHARLSLPGGVFHGSATNLFVTGRKSVSRRALHRQLVKQIKAEGLEYGLIIRRMDDPAITGSAELSTLELILSLQSDQSAPEPVLLAYRIYPNGREELVRGVELKEVPVRAWRDVVGVSKERTVENFLASTDESFVLRLRASSGDAGFVPSAGVESAVITPDILFKELDVSRARGRNPPPPPVSKP